MTHANEQFAEDYLLVTMNDQGAYSHLMELAGEHDSPSTLADIIREEYEEAISDLIGQGDTTDQMLARQLLLSWGVAPFDIIARDLLAMKAEVSA